jgi:MFS transporter, DHA1 family, inner membrane transport protein
MSLSPVSRALLSLAVAGFAIGTGEFVMLGLLPNVAADLSVSIPTAGHLISAYALGVVVGAPLLTAVSVRLPRKGLLLSLMAMFAVGNVVSALAPSFDTELAARFLAGLPHGAFFGVGSVVATGLVDVSRRSAAMSVMFTGLTVANIVGVPLTTLLGQNTSWRLVFVVVAVIGLLAVVAIAGFVPRTPAPVHVDGPSPLRRELNTFRNPQIWLVLSIAMIGGGGLFATFSYITPMMTHLAGYAESSVTLLLVLFGLGMTVGNLVGARLADRWLMPTMYFGIGAEIIVALIFLVADHNKVASAVMIFLFPAVAMGMLAPLQTRIIMLSHDAPNLAAAAMQGAFNVSNTLGAWLGGLVIAAGFGYGAPNAVAASLATVGLGLALWSGALDRHRRPVRAVPAVALAVTPAEPR